MAIRNTEYVLPFYGLSVGMHTYHFELGEVFFADFPEQDFRNPAIQVDLTLDKKANLSMELDFRFFGSVEVDCDRSLQSFRMPIEAERKLLVKFADEYNNDDDEILFLEHNAHSLNIAQILYETSALAIPLRRIHPEWQKIVEAEDALLLSSGPEPEPQENKEPDPRWNELKKLFNNRN